MLPIQIRQAELRGYPDDFVRGMRSDVAPTGVEIQPVLTLGRDPADAVRPHLADAPTDLVVLATHQYGGITRWWHKAVAEPMARKSKTMTLLIPYGVRTPTGIM